MRSRIVLASRSARIGSGLTYETPQSIPLGALVRAPVQKKWLEGIVIGRERATREQEFQVRTVQQSIGEQPLLPEALVKTAVWMATRYRSSLRCVLSVVLPPPPWKSLLPLPTLVVRRTEKAGEPRGKSQRLALDVLGSRELARDTLRAESGCSLATLRSLVSAGWIQETQRGDSVSPQQPISIDAVHLTPSQQVAYDVVAGSTKPSLLFGVTGSGKTEIYAALIRDCLRQNRQTILLVPEILLAEHSVERFAKLVGLDRLVVLHSKLTQSERRRAWQQCHNGSAQLVIGSRSALFAPVPNLGLVIIDEEHEWTYKNEQSPRYHARETAEALCSFASARLVLGTATPSLEAWSKANSGAYALVELKERYGGAVLPHVRIVDLRDVRFGKLYPFSPTLLEAIGQRLDRKEQSVLFFNRRGIASALLCLSCRRRLVSQSSGMPYTVHRRDDGRPYLLDHVSGDMRDIPERCPGCASTELFSVGAGTHRIEDILHEQFPQAHVLRADSDTLATPNDIRALLDAMRSRKADILIGTQSVVKGLDLPGVTLAAVLVADLGLSLPHFRAGERVFQLLTQLVGRSGRHQPGEVIIQTFRPDADEICLSAAHDVRSYLEKETAVRLRLQYPPATEMIRFILRGAKSRERAQTLKQALALAAEHHKVTVSVSAAQRIFAPEQWQVLLRGTNLQELLIGMDLQDVAVDVDPVECL